MGLHYMNMKNKTAFSLIELSVVLVIVAIFLSTSMPVAKSVITNYRVRITNERMQAIYEAMGNFARSNKRLPCAASILLAKGNADYGKEVTCGTTPYTPGTDPAASTGVFQSNWSNNLLYGAVPTAALGLPADMAEDGFGNKIAYAIIRGYTNASTFGTNDPSTYIYNSYTGSSYVWQTCYRIPIYEKRGSSYIEITSPATGYTGDGAGACDLYAQNNQAIFVLISNGANQYGAFPSKGTSQNTGSFTISGFPAIDSDEGNNMLRIDGMSYSYTGPGGYFFNWGGCGGGCFNYTFISSSSNESFDDIVFYKTQNQMIVDFNKPLLMAQALLTIGSEPADPMPILNMAASPQPMP
jgi:prepilin-type N-terminal cleavage/methylation domain-containing protein